MPPSTTSEEEEEKEDEEGEAEEPTLIIVVVERHLTASTRDRFINALNANQFWGGQGEHDISATPPRAAGLALNVPLKGSKQTRKQAKLLKATTKLRKHILNTRYRICRFVAGVSMSDASFSRSKRHKTKGPYMKPKRTVRK